MKRAIFSFSILIFLSSCHGYITLSGNVNEGGEALKGATVKLVSKKGTALGNVKTDESGHYEIGKSTTPMAGSYYVIFEKRGYKTDTVVVKKGRGFSAVACDHSMEKK